MKIIMGILGVVLYGFFEFIMVVTFSLYANNLNDPQFFACVAIVMFLSIVCVLRVVDCIDFMFKTNSTRLDEIEFGNDIAADI